MLLLQGDEQFLEKNCPKRKKEKRIGGQKWQKVTASNISTMRYLWKKERKDVDKVLELICVPKGPSQMNNLMMLQMMKESQKVK